MCLLAVLSRVHPDHPLVVAANRDEFLARPASGVTVLRDAPRTLGGRDAVGGGTWLAVNLRGVVAALTNTPLPGAPDPARRSRGELPLLLTEHATAAAADAAAPAPAARDSTRRASSMDGWADSDEEVRAMEFERAEVRAS